MKDYQQRLMVHSCCPNKRNIYPPMFILKETILKGKLEEWECTGNCGTRITIGGSMGKAGPHDYRQE